MRKILLATATTILTAATALAVCPGRSDTRFPVTGSPKVLVILAEYNDTKFSIPDAYDYFRDMLNQEGFNEYFGKGSSLDYFRDNSLGTFTPQFDVYGPVTLPKDMAYYGENINNFYDTHAHEMVIDACRILDEDIDFSAYDADGDGVIENVFIVYAGYGEASGGEPNTVWPHAALISTKEPEPQIVDGVQLDRYACINELEKDYYTGIGCFCHEFIHVLGLPDVYPTDRSQGFTPDKWDVMDHGSVLGNMRRPCYMNAYERWALGWLEPEELEIGKDYELQPIYENQAYVIRTSNPDEFFLLENRQKKNWDQNLPGHGMLLWHIDYDATAWQENTPNNNPDHLRIDVVEADSKATSATVGADPFPGTSKVTTLSQENVTGFCSWQGENLGIKLENITELADGTITFHVSTDDSAVKSIVAEGWRIAGRTLTAAEPVTVTDLTGTV